MLKGRQATYFIGGHWHSFRVCSNGTIDYIEPQRGVVPIWEVRIRYKNYILTMFIKMSSDIAIK